MMPKLTKQDVASILEVCFSEINYPLVAADIPAASIGKFLDQLDDASPTDWHAPLSAFVLLIENKFLKRGWEVLDLDEDWFDRNKEAKFKTLIDFILANAIYVWNT